MDNMIGKLWNGEIAPCEHCGAQDARANQLFSTMVQVREALSRELSEKHRETLIRYADSTEDYLLCMMELAFSDGFRIGTRLALECME